MGLFWVPPACHAPAAWLRRMTLFLDTEFNGFHGPLISIALVSDDGDEFYGVRHLPPKLRQWVKKNVVPNLNQSPEDDTVLRGRLAAFLHGHARETIVADWPLDFSHLLSFLCFDDQRAGPSALNMRLVPQEPLPSVIPHNALFDARALMIAQTGRLSSVRA